MPKLMDERNTLLGYSFSRYNKSFQKKEPIMAKFNNVLDAKLLG